MGFSVCFSVEIKSCFLWFYLLPFSLESVPEKYHYSGQSQEQPHHRAQGFTAFTTETTQAILPHLEILVYNQYVLNS